MIGYLILQDLDDSTITLNTYEDWSLILGNKTIGLPQPKTQLVDNDGGDGTIDLTEVTSGEIKYKDRINKYPFTLVDNFENLPDRLSEILNKIHGKRFKIFHYDDLEHYYIGRLSINDFSVNKGMGKFTIEATCNPYKYKLDKTYFEYTVNGTKNISLNNERKRVIPKITASANMILTFKDKEISISKGTFEYLNIYLNEGTTDIVVTGNGTIKFEYQEASL